MAGTQQISLQTVGVKGMSEEAKPRTPQEIDKDIHQLQQQLESLEGTPTEVYTRIVGYYRSLAGWNKGKREEYNHRWLYEQPQKQAVLAKTREVRWHGRQLRS